MFFSQVCLCHLTNSGSPYTYIVSGLCTAFLKPRSFRLEASKNKEDAIRSLHRRITMPASVIYETLDLVISVIYACI